METRVLTTNVYELELTFKVSEFVKEECDFGYHTKELIKDYRNKIITYIKHNYTPANYDFVINQLITIIINVKYFNVNIYCEDLDINFEYTEYKDFTNFLTFTLNNNF